MAIDLFNEHVPITIGVLRKVRRTEEELVLEVRRDLGYQSDYKRRNSILDFCGYQSRGF